MRHQALHFNLLLSRAHGAALIKTVWPGQPIGRYQSGYQFAVPLNSLWRKGGQRQDFTKVLFDSGGCNGIHDIILDNI